MAQNFSLEQGLTSTKLPWEEIFPEELFYREERSSNPEITKPASQ